MKRQNDTIMLRLDKVFQKIAGFDDYPVQSTISRFLSGEHDKRRILSYSLDANIPHFYGAIVAHFHLVILTYNLMNLFKELVLEQMDKKRMGKWIRQRLFFIAGRLVRGGRRFILKLQEEGAYRVDNMAGLDFP